MESPSTSQSPLSPHEFSQYGRQMIVPEIGLAGQERLKNSSILVVGAGGLGSPAIAYLAGAGIGMLGIVDGDTVEISNLHRQIIHSRATVGDLKCESAAKYVQSLNPQVKICTYPNHLTVSNALEIARGYSLILDCTDSPMSRYLVNDTGIVLGVTVVSASALKLEGQLAVYGYKNGPCYRCVFPVPPPAHSVGACSDAGILGAVVGIMGVMQAIEALKVIALPDIEFTPSLTLFGALNFPPWRTMRIRGRQPACAVCGDNPSITATNLADQNYIQFCGAATPEPLPSSLRLEYTQVNPDALVLDVRPAVQFGITRVPGSVNVPLSDLRKGAQVPSGDLIVVCRLGNDSQEAVRILRDRGVDAKDVIGGLSKWGPSLHLPEY